MIIVDHHHQALPAWAEYRRTLPAAPRLLTLDHHTDTSKPFRNNLQKNYGQNHPQIELLRAQWLKEIDFHQPASITAALDKLSNDEHVVTAIQSNIISSALVIAHDARDTDLDTYREHRIICRAVSAARTVTRADRDQVLESEFLNEKIASFNQLLHAAAEPPLSATPYILDIDLDYLNTLASVAPQDARTIRALARNAGLISIATEPEYVRYCSLDAELTSEVLLEQLLLTLDM